MEKIKQCIEVFVPRTLGEREVKTLEAVISRMNSNGWKVDQIVPLTFHPIGYGAIEISSGILLCSYVGK